MGLTVKVFVGVEYECPRGHRFISASPEKAVRTKTATATTSTASKIVTSDIPLYMACPCRASSKSIWLMKNYFGCSVAIQLLYNFYIFY